MFKILDTKTKKWLQSVPSYGDLSDRDLKEKGGRVFKRKSDVALHINSNIDFYKRYSDRFEVVQYELVEVDSEAIEIFVAHSQERKEKRELDIKARIIEYDKQRIARLEEELNKLKNQHNVR